VDDARIGRAIRVLRHRRGWRQRDLSDRSGVSQNVISQLELGQASRHRVETIRDVLSEFGAGLEIGVRWGGRGDLPDLLDADHAWLQQHWVALLRAAGWETWPEASFSHYGERGIIDVLGFHPRTRTLNVSEIKTGIWDVGDVLGRLDVKSRNAIWVARQRSWQPLHVIPSLVLLDGRTARRRVADHEALFAPFDLRGRVATGWLKRPDRAASGLLAFIRMPTTASGRLRQAGRQRVRLRRTDASVASAP
jgi:transcriptional regulator with XRE-family HTH domain